MMKCATVVGGNELEILSFSLVRSKLCFQLIRQYIFQVWHWLPVYYELENKW